MNVLHLFAGAGGGCLADRLLGHRCVGYVEWEPYCQAVLQARIADGLLDAAPIFGDVRDFVRCGFAREYRGVADVVAGGFPCQPFSVAGKRAGSADERNMWPAFRDVVREVRPRYVFAENVPGLLTWNGGSYFGAILGDLAALGFAVRWTVLGADDCGAPHRRKRLWILGYSENGQGLDVRGIGRDASCQWTHGPGHSCQGCDGNAADALSDPIRHEPGRTEPGWPGSPEPRHDGAAGHVADAERPERWPHVVGRRHIGEGCDSEGQAAGGPVESGQAHWWSLDPADMGDASEQRLEGSSDNSGERGQVTTEKPSGGPTESRVGLLVDELASGLDFARAAFGGQIPRVAQGIPNRVDRLRALGNGQVSLCAAAAWRLLGGER